MTERCKANPCCGDHHGKCEIPLPQHRSGLWLRNSDEYRDNYAVDQFAMAMKVKLAQKRLEGRGGWDRKDECSQGFLSQLLREHIDKGDPIDVANFAMMLHQRGERISPPPALTAASLPDFAPFIEASRAFLIEVGHRAMTVTAPADQREIYDD